MSDATSEPKQRRRKLSDAQLSREAREDLAFVMSTPEGRRFIWRMLNGHCNLFGGSYTAEAVSTSYNEGKRAVGIAVLQELQRDAPIAYVEMLRERMVQPEQRRAEAKEIHRKSDEPVSPSADYDPLASEADDEE